MAAARGLRAARPADFRAGLDWRVRDTGSSELRSHAGLSGPPRYSYR